MVFQEGIETIFATLDWTDIGDRDLSNTWLLGTRHEGQLGIGTTVDGYVPMASISEWTFDGSTGQAIHIAINSHDPEVTLVIDVLDGNGTSLLPSGPNEFTGSLEIEQLKLPGDGTYMIQVNSPTGFIRHFVGNPASEAKVYGWYQLSLE